MNAILSALVTYFSWGSGDIFSALASRKVGTFISAFWTDLLGVIFLSFFIPFFLQDLEKINITNFLITLGLSIILWTAWPMFLEALRIGNSSIVGTIAGSFGGVVVILSTVFLKESLSLNQMTAIILILVGVIFSSLTFSDLRNKKILQNKGTMLAILVMLIWGFYFTFIRIPVDQIGWFWPAYIAVFTGTLIMTILCIIKKEKVKKIPQKQLLNVGASSFLTTLGTVSYNIGITQGLTAIVAPIASSYPTFFVLLSRIVFKDKLTKQQWLGIVFGLFGIIILAFSS